MLSGATLGK